MPTPGRRPCPSLGPSAASTRAHDMPRTNVAGTTAPPGGGAHRCPRPGERQHPIESRAGNIPPTNDARNSITATPTQLIGLIKAHIAKGDKAKEKADQHYMAAGQHLKALKAEHDAAGGTWGEWEELLKEKIDIGKSRASELMQIADGTKTVEQVRADRTERNKQLRARQVSPSRDGENAKPSVDDGENPNGRKTAAEVAATTVSPLPVSASSWRVEITTDDGQRLVNGARFKTKKQAALYALRSAEDMLSPLWRPILRKQGHKPRIIVMTRVLASADAANVNMRFPKERLGEANVRFRDGDCHLLERLGEANVRFRDGDCHLLLNWHLEDETEPSCPTATARTDRSAGRHDPAPAKPDLGTGNGSDPEQSAAKRREEFATLEHGTRDDAGDPDPTPEALAAADGLDIPECLRREPKAVSS